MTIAWTGTGGLATRLGALGGAMNEANAARGATLNARVSTILGQYLAALQQEVAGTLASRDTHRNAFSRWLSDLQLVAQNTLLDQVDAQAAYRLIPRSLDQALRIVLKDMADNAVTVQRPGTLTVTPAAGGSNAGDGKLVATGTGGDGLPLTLMYNETLAGAVTLDRSSGGTAFAEPVNFLGAAPAATKFDYNWPAGSGANATPVFVNGGSTSVGTLLGTVGSFENWEVAGAAYKPTGSTVLVGVPGTSIVRTGSSLTGTYALSYAGDGAELTSTFFPLSAGQTLQPLTTYAVSVWVASLTGAYAGGQVNLSLTDVTGAVVNDAAGTANTVTLAATTASSYPTWTHVGGFFRTPKAVPASLGVTLRFGTALAAAEVLAFDHLALALADTLYPGGPYVKLFSGKAEARKDDTFSLAVVNNVSLTTPGNGALQFLFDRLFDLREKGILLPSASSPTLADGLIA